MNHATVKVIMSISDQTANAASTAALIARIERLPITQKLLGIRMIAGVATFFDAYTVLAIAFAMPELVREWKLAPFEIGMIISAGDLGQLPSPPRLR